MKKEAVARFESKIIPEPMSGCWLWTGILNWRGYGQFSVGGVNIGAHRFAYETHVGPIPADREIDHLCRVCCCVNPKHMEAVPHIENIRRASALRTQCPHGHSYAEHGRIRRRKNGHTERMCKTCKNAYEIIRRAALKKAGAL